MKPIILNGKELADKICTNLKERTQILKANNINPELIIVTASTDPASKIYVRNKIKRCDEIGIHCEHIVVNNLEENNTMDYVKSRDVPCIIQMPFESTSLNVYDLDSYIEPYNDVDGFVSWDNAAMLFMGMNPYNYPCTPKGIVKLLEYYHIDIQDKNVCVIGRSNIVGKPLAMMLLDKNATVTICHSHTSKWDKYEYIKQADIIISATGCLNTLTLKDIKTYGIDDEIMNRKIIVDVGMNRNKEGKLCGDIPQDIKDLSYAYTPVPGGIGPMTVAALMENVVEYYEHDLYLIQYKEELR